MKRIVFCIIIASFASCSKADNNDVSKVDSVKIIDSINAAITKINDSIRSTDRFKTIEGTYALTHNEIKGKGSITFSKIGKDEYKMTGGLKNGNNFLDIDGIGKIKSKRHIKFDGIIKQSVEINNNGKLDTRTGSKTFATKDGGKTYRLQEMVNDAGFVDYIDIKF